MRKFFLLIVLVVTAGCCADNIEVSRIWNENYSAFPSIVEFQGKYYVAFREASSHIFDENGNAVTQHIAGCMEHHIAHQRKHCTQPPYVIPPPKKKRHGDYHGHRRHRE